MSRQTVLDFERERELEKIRGKKKRNNNGGGRRTAATARSFRVEKHDGPRPWRVVNAATGAMVIRYPTKRQATQHVAMLNGDLSVAPEWYRDQIRSARRSMPERDALRYAMLGARELGLGPGQVRADPKTGEPLEGLVADAPRLKWGKTARGYRSKQAFLASYTDPMTGRTGIVRQNLVLHRDWLNEPFTVRLELWNEPGTVSMTYGTHDKVTEAKKEAAEIAATLKKAP